MPDYIVGICPGGAYFRLTAMPGESATVLALDPGLRLGWAAIDTRSKLLLAGGFIELDRNRLYASGYDAVDTMLKEFSPMAVAFEEYFISGGAQDKESIEVRGSMKAPAQKAGIPCGQLHPAKIRARLGLSGRPSDPQIRDSMLSLFSVPAKFQPNPAKKSVKFFPADTWDACAVAWSYAHMEEL